MTERSASDFEKSVRLKYDLHEINARGIGWFVALFISAVVLIMLFVWWFLGTLVQIEDAHRPVPSALALPGALPPEPRLQPSPGHPTLPRQDLARLHEQEDRILGSYGWVDREHGIARIPIDRALDIAVQQHLLAREAATQPQAQGAAP